MSVPYLACMVAAAAFYHLPPRVLPSIEAVEGGKIGLEHVNRNGSADLGVMQVNTLWIEPLAASVNLPSASVRARLLADPCFNIAAAAAILRVSLQEARGDLMTAVGLYHSHTPQLQEAYLRRVLRSARALF
jgi:Transglycosylase SLT domain